MGKEGEIKISPYPFFSSPLRFACDSIININYSYGQ